MKIPYLKFVESVWTFEPNLRLRAAPGLRIHLHESDGADVRASRRFQLVVFRQHDAEHERGRDFASVCFADSDVGERARALLVELARTKEVHREQLSVEQELRRRQSHLGRTTHPRCAILRGIDIPVLDELLRDGLAGHVVGTGEADGGGNCHH